MLTCFILIRVEAKKEDQVYDNLVKVKEIEGIREVFGEYDMICRMEASSMMTSGSLPGGLFAERYGSMNCRCL